MMPFILKASSITLFPFNAAPLVVDDTHVNFQAVRDAILASDFDLAVQLGSVKAFYKTATKGKVEVSEEGVTFNGEVISGFLAQKMVTFFTEGLPVDHYCLFLENLMANPSMTSRKELFLFLESADLPITEDGHFLAYKAVDGSFKDKHTHTFDNSPGQVLQMERAKVDDDRTATCSYGFHAAAYEYAKNFLGSSGDKLVAVKINPADVVSVPADYNNQKLRTCRYEVMFEIPGAIDTFKGVNYFDTSELREDEKDPNIDYDMWGYNTDEDDQD